MALDPTAKKEFRAELAEFCKLAEKYESRWHYTMRRPFTGLGDAPQTFHRNDCSGYVSLCMFWAGRHTGHSVHDPLDEHYSGYGNTDTSILYLNDHRAPQDLYRIGDVAFYGSGNDPSHMTICRRAGTRETATWSSFGQEAGPNPVKLHYRSGLIGVFRHPALL